MVCWKLRTAERERGWVRDVRNARGGEWVAILNKVVQAGLTEKGLFKQTTGVGEGACCMVIWGKSFLEKETASAKAHLTKAQ